MQITISSLPTFEAMIFKYISAYLKHQFTANTRHGTHSPFVYKLADEVIYDFSLKKVYTELSQQRKKLLNDPNLVAKSAQISKLYLPHARVLQLIYRLAEAQQPSHILELHANLGLSTSYLAKACPMVTVTTIEENPLLVAITERTLLKLAIDNVDLQLGVRDELFYLAIAQADHLGIVYLNEGSVNLNYFEQCLTKVNEHSLLIFEGMHRTEKSAKNWEHIKNHPEVTVTIDLFSIGLVYFRKGQAKEHFKLKYA